MPISDIWSIFTRQLSIAATKYKVLIHSFVLMNNHLHLILTTPSENIDEFMRHFLTESSRSICKKASRTNHVFGSRYNWSVLSNPHSFAYVYKYVYRNPVKAGMSLRCEDYRWSTLNKAGQYDIPTSSTVDDTFCCLPEPNDLLTWLNEPTPKELEGIIGTSLRRKEFAFSKGKGVQLKVRKLEKSYLWEGSKSRLAPFGTG